MPELERHQLISRRTTLAGMPTARHSGGILSFKKARSNYTAKADPLYCQYEGFEPEPDMLFKHHIGLNQIDYLAGCGFEQGVHVVVSNPNTRT